MVRPGVEQIEYDQRMSRRVAFIAGRSALSDLAMSEQRSKESADFLVGHARFDGLMFAVGLAAYRKIGATQMVFCSEV